MHEPPGVRKKPCGTQGEERRRVSLECEPERASRTERTSSHSYEHWTVATSSGDEPRKSASVATQSARPLAGASQGEKLSASSCVAGGRASVSREWATGRQETPTHRSAAALGLAVDRDDAGRALLRVVALGLVDDDLVDDGGRAVTARTIAGRQYMGETSAPERGEKVQRTRPSKPRHRTRR